MARLAAIMRIPITYVLTHDSIGVGEDGPTHQPIEQLTMLRSTQTLQFSSSRCYRNYCCLVSCNYIYKNTYYFSLKSSKLPQLEGSSKEALKGGLS